MPQAFERPVLTAAGALPGWALAGLALALALSVTALTRARSARGAYYEGEVYGMDAAAHRRWAGVSALFAGAFLVSAFVPAIPAVAVFAPFTLFALLYGASFVRGADEG